MLLLVMATGLVHILAQDNQLNLSGELMTDERFLFRDDNPWAWNENRLTLNLDKRMGGYSKFHSEIWLRNLGLPKISSSADLYNKGITDPYNLEIREAYVQLNGIISKNLDVTIGRQRIAWGTADVINPTDNLNPYDMEDILAFGRHRGSDAINLQYYFTYDFSLQAVYIPIFQPANLPAGIFSELLGSSMGGTMPGMSLESYSDSVLLPAFNLGESATTGFRFKGFAAGMDFSLSYVWGRSTLPFNTMNTLVPVDAQGGLHVDAQLTYPRNHILGADLVTSLAGIGLWAEAAVFIPENEVVMSNDITAFFPGSPQPVLMDSVILEKEPYLKFVLGADYNFSDGSYLNLQYIHGFIHEAGREALNDYFFLRYDKSFLNSKLKVSPLGGAFIVADWKDIGENFALAYMPGISYQATPNAIFSLSAVVFDGKGNNLFARMKEYDMFMFRLQYSF